MLLLTKKPILLPEGAILSGLLIMNKVYKKVKGTFVIDTFQINPFMLSEFFHHA